MQYLVIIAALVGFLVWAALRLRRTRRPAIPTPSTAEPQWELSSARTFSAPVSSDPTHSSVEEALNPGRVAEQTNPSSACPERRDDLGANGTAAAGVERVTRPLPASTAGRSALAGHGVFSPAEPRRRGALTGSQQVVGNSEQIATSIASPAADGAQVPDTAVMSTPAESPDRTAHTSAALAGTNTAQVRIAQVNAVPGRRTPNNSAPLASRAEVEALNAAVAENTSSFTDISPTHDLPETGTGTSPMSCPIPVVPLSAPPKATMRRLPSRQRGSSKLSVPNMRRTPRPAPATEAFEESRSAAVTTPLPTTSAVPAVVPAPAPTLEPLNGFDVFDEPTDATAPSSLPSFSTSIPAASPRSSAAAESASAARDQEPVPRSRASSFHISSPVATEQNGSDGLAASQQGSASAVPGARGQQSGPALRQTSAREDGPGSTLTGDAQVGPQWRATVAPLAASSAPVVAGAVYTPPSPPVVPTVPASVGDQHASSTPAPGDRVYAAPMTQSLPRTVHSTYFGHTSAPAAQTVGAVAADDTVPGGADRDHTATPSAASQSPLSSPDQDKSNLIDLTELERLAQSRGR